MAQYDKKTLWSDFRVGLLAFVALLLLVGGIFLAGGEKGLFLAKTSLVKAELTDVGGLKKGASVTMAGMAVGRVLDLRFSKNPGHTVEILMQVRSDVRDRIKLDSVPTVRTQGMLGDRYVDLSIGSETAGPLPDEETLTGEPASDFDRTLQRTEAVLDETEKLLGAVNRKEGTVGELFYDKDFYIHLSELARELRDLIQDVKKNPRKYLKFSLF